MLRTPPAARPFVHVLLFALAALVALAGCRSAPPTEQVDLSSRLDGIDATFVVRDLATGVTRVHRPERAAMPLTPASTFKIPNSIIGLETGVLADAGTVIAWDPVRDPVADDQPEAWKGDQTLASAFRLSCVWYYRELARRIGAERMQDWINRLGYGNRSIEGGIDLFWLRGGLRISALEQVGFLERLVTHRLPVRPATEATLREIMLIESTPAYRLYGKTGTAVPSETEQIGWLVGYVEVRGRTSVFAFNMIDPRVWQDFPRERRVAIVKGLLASMGVLPAQADPTTQAGG